ncbi:MAG: hypothetical protein WC668_02380 [Patescibacteria group bacterium]
MHRHVSLIVIGFLALSVTTLTGCPPINEAELGGFDIEGDLSTVVDKIDDDFVGEVAKALEKGGGGGGIEGLSQEELQAIGNSIKAQAVGIDIYLYPNDGGMGKGGGSGYYSFYIPIVDHQFRAHCGGIRPGNYSLSVSFRDEQSNTLLSGWKDVLVEGGVNRNENLVMDFVYGYPFQFSIFGGLPGWYQTDQWGYGEAMLVAPDGISYHVSWTWGKSGIVFKVCLPLNFAGGVLYIVDGDGNDVYCDLPLVISDIDWGNFRFSDFFHFPYVESDALGGLDLNIGFAWENQRG